MLDTILSVTPFSINYNKTHKSQSKYEIKYKLYKISPKNKKPKSGPFWFFKNLGFSKPLSSPTKDPIIQQVA